MPDLAIVPDMAAIHEIAAVTDPRDAAARDRAGIHGHGFADGAARTDLKLREFAAIAQRLRWRTQRHEGIDRAALADRGLRRDVDVTDELAVGADDDVAANDTVWTDRGALADHSAVLNPRGGIDRAHRMVRYRFVRFEADVLDFAVVSAQFLHCPVTYGYGMFRHCARKARANTKIEIGIEMECASEQTSGHAAG